MGDVSDYYRDLDDNYQDILDNIDLRRRRVAEPISRRSTIPHKNLLTRDSLWSTLDGRRIRVRDMEDEHLYNAAHYLVRRQHAPEWQRVFLDELQRRILTKEHFTLDLSVDELDCLVEALW